MCHKAVAMVAEDAAKPAANAAYMSSTARSLLAGCGEVVSLSDLGRREVLVMVMRKHQRYFPVYSQGGEELLPYFITVANGLIHPPTVIAGIYCHFCSWALAILPYFLHCCF